MLILRSDKTWAQPTRTDAYYNPVFKPAAPSPHTTIFAERKGTVCSETTRPQAEGSIEATSDSR